MLRLARLLGSLSLATDMADGFAPEKSLRTAVLAARLAGVVGADPATRKTAYWAALLRFLGCTAFAHEEGRAFAAGDDISLRRTLAMVDFGRPATFVRRAVTGIAPDAPLLARARAVGRLLASPRAPSRHAAAQCEAGAQLALDLGLHDVAAVAALREERWDGRGPRGRARGTGLPLAARLADTADVAELFAWHHSPGEALEELVARRGGQLEPALVDAFVDHAPQLWEGLFGPTAWDPFLDAEPAPHAVVVSMEEAGRCIMAFSRFADLASVYTLGHSQRVARLAGDAAAAAGLPAADQQLATLGGYAHDLGRVAIPVGIWEKPGPLSPYEWERVRSHSAHSESILRAVPELEGLADAAGAAHERGNGHGYHRRLRPEAIPMAGRLVAAADVHVALLSNRPHRPALAPPRAAATLQEMAQEGQLDPAAVRAVLLAAGAPRAPAAGFPRGLTQREVEVIRLVAVGRTNREVGTLLGMSQRTAQKHVMNVYAKLGLESRAALALFAVEHDLLDGARQAGN